MISPTLSRDPVTYSTGLKKNLSNMSGRRQHPVDRYLPVPTADHGGDYRPDTQNFAPNTKFYPN